jgi:glutathione S-transferase
MSDVVLFGAPVGPFVEKVRRALELKKVPYRLAEPTSPADFRRWNPQTGKIPVLEIDGERVYDSTLICDRVEERYPQPPLLSPDGRTRAAQRLLEDWADESLYWYLMALRWCDAHARATADQILGSLSPPVRLVARLVIPRRVTGMCNAQGLGRLPVPVLVAQLAERLDDLVVTLGADPFFFGDAPSRGDLAVYGQLHMGLSGPTPEVGELVERRRPLQAWMARVRAATGG